MNILHKASKIFFGIVRKMRNISSVAPLVAAYLPKIARLCSRILHKNNIPAIRAFIIAHLPKAGQLFFGPSRKTRIVSSVGLMFALCAFGAVAVAPTSPETSNLPRKVVEIELELPNLS
ncbi:MAG: hypothetical protein VB032_06245, partial [Burkholderiaceae bacterium]|nr:hypothetical protein [Burkholderiaceae bacterium]